MADADFELREMTRSEIGRICEIDVTEEGTCVYKWVNGQIQRVPEKWQRRPRPVEDWRGKAERIKLALDEGGLAIGAFDGQRLVGFVFLRHRLTEKVALLQALWVSRAWRRRGIATALLRRVLDAARGEGARLAYVSACPSESACGFYLHEGFRPTVWVHRELYDREPEDIHMILALQPSGEQTGLWPQELAEGSLG
jgi:GNAT superfamily N-acetyltransferase